MEAIGAACSGIFRVQIPADLAFLLRENQQKVSSKAVINRAAVFFNVRYSGIKVKFLSEQEVRMSDLCLTERQGVKHQASNHR